MLAFRFWLCSAKMVSGNSTGEVALKNRIVCVAVSSAEHQLGKYSLSRVETKESSV